MTPLLLPRSPPPSLPVPMRRLVGMFPPHEADMDMDSDSYLWGRMSQDDDEEGEEIDCRESDRSDDAFNDPYFEVRSAKQGRRAWVQWVNVLCLKQRIVCLSCTPVLNYLHLLNYGRAQHAVRYLLGVVFFADPDLLASLDARFARSKEKRGKIFMCLCSNQFLTVSEYLWDSGGRGAGEGWGG